MSWSPTVTHSSKAFPGVSFEIHRMGIARRAEIDRKTLELRQRMRVLEVLYPPQSAEESRIGDALAAAEKKAISVDSAEKAEAVIQDEVKPILSQLAAAVTPEVHAERGRINIEYASLDAQVRVRWILEGLIKVSHRIGEEQPGEFDGMTAEQLVEFGPPELALEIYDALARGGQLSGAEAKNLPSPGISSGAEAGATKDSTAPAANMTVSSESETATRVIPIR